MANKLKESQLQKGNGKQTSSTLTTKNSSLTCNHAFSTENLHTSPICSFLRLHRRHMDSTGGSTISASTASSISAQTPPSPPVLFLEVSLISAQDLTPISKSTRTYAVAWINPSLKLTTQTDHHQTNPTWNDKLTFRVDGQFLLTADAAIHVEIYTVSWFRHVIVGTVRVLIRDILGPQPNIPKNTKFVTLQVRGPSGAPQGILNIGVTLLDNSLKRMLLQQHPAEGEKTENPEHDNDELVNKIHLWRSMSVGSEMNSSDHDNFPLKEGSICNGSEVCSDIGPSASIVAANIAHKMQQPPPAAVKHSMDDETGSSVLEELTYEEAIAKGYRNGTKKKSWRKGGMYEYDESDVSSMSSKHSRRNSDGSLFSCFVAGMEFTIVCGGSNKPNSKNYNNSMSKRKNKFSD